MDELYRTVTADPPWHESGGGKIKRGADRHYSLMRTPEIIATMREAMAEKVAADAHLYLWVTNNHLKCGLEVMEAVGFRYVTIITWMKDRIGLGQYFRGITEHCLFGVRGSLPYKTINDKRAQGKTGFFALRRKHSQKPEELYAMVERVSYPPFLELFARQRPGWSTEGNESLGRHIETGPIPED